MHAYGAISRHQHARPELNGRRIHVALIGLSAVAVLATVATFRSPALHGGAPVALASKGDWLSSIDSQFSDNPTSMQEKSVRQQILAGKPATGAATWQHLTAGASNAAGYTDGLTGARLDQLTPVGVVDPNNVPDDEKQQMVSNLTRSGVELDHWPWDSPFDDADEPLQHHIYQKKRCQWKAGFYSCWEDKLPFVAKGNVTQLRAAKSESVMGDLMGAFADAPHRNPMLSQSQLQALEATDAKNAARHVRASSRRGMQQRTMESLAMTQHKNTEKMAMRKSAMLAKTAEAQASRKQRIQRRQMAKPQVRAALKHQSPLFQLKGEEGGGNSTGNSTGDSTEWGVDVAWDGHNDRCSETTPNCNALGKRGDGAPGVHVYGWPWNHDTTESMKQKNLAVEMQGDATQLLHLTASHTGNADAEEAAAQALQQRSFDMLKLASFQKLEEDDVSNATKTRWPMFAKWYWTPDSTEYVERQGIPVDQWPWEDCTGIDCKHAVDERRWERAVGQKLHQDATDMSELADADAQMGLFPKLQALEEEEAAGANATNATTTTMPCPPDAPNCHKLEDLGVPVSHWPWAEAKAKRQWETRLARQLTRDADELYSDYQLKTMAMTQMKQRRLGARHAPSMARQQ